MHSTCYGSMYDGTQVKVKRTHAAVMGAIERVVTKLTAPVVEADGECCACYPGSKHLRIAAHMQSA